MTVNQLIKQKNMTKYRLSKESHIPYTTINDICAGRAELKKCTAETVYRIAQALDTTVEALLADAFEPRPSFELFKSNVCHRLKEQGDVGFIIRTLESGEIRELYQKKWYPESLYLLAMLDYVSRENGVPLCTEYDDLRRCRLTEVLYPSGVLAMCAATRDDLAMKRSVEKAIPEFMRFNIVESEVRDVI